MPTRLLLRVSVFAALCFAAAGCSRAPSRNVILVTIDTLRADRVGCYGYERAETPTLDRLAREGVRFEHAVTTAPITLPAHASLFTGLYPPSHGVRHNGIFHLDVSAPTLAEAFRAAGARTGAFVAAAPVAGAFGLGRGFEVYDDAFLRQVSPDARDPFPFQRRADRVLSSARRWLEGLDDGERYFAWIHLFDPHTPYAPPGEWNAAWRARLNEAEGYNLTQALYDGETAFADAQLGVFLEWLASTPAGEDVVVVVTSDHGEGLGDHGEPTHGIFLYESTMHVPLIVWGGPAAKNAGQIVAGTVNLVDMAPTILDLAGLKAKAVRGEGVSLARLVRRGGAAPSRAIYGEAIAAQFEHQWAPSFGVWKDGWKFIRLPKPEIYNLADDPREERNLYDSERARVEEMGAALAAMAENSPGSSSTPHTPDAETRAYLASLGYVGHNVVDFSSEALASLRDPKDMVPLIPLLLEGEQLMGEEKWKEAEAVWRRVRGASPEHYTTSVNQAICFLNTNRLGEAKAAAQEMVERGYETAAVYHILGRAEALRGNAEEAERLYRRAVLLDGLFAPAWEDLGGLFVERGDAAQAEAVWLEGLEQNPRSTALLNRMGDFYLSANKLDAALQFFHRSVSVQPTPNALSGMAIVHAQAGRYEEALQGFSGALHLEPSRVDDVYNMAKIYLRLGDKEAARAHFEIFLQKAPKDLPQTREARARVAELKKETKGAPSPRR